MFEYIYLFLLLCYFSGDGGASGFYGRKSVCVLKHIYIQRRRGIQLVLYRGSAKVCDGGDNCAVRVSERHGCEHVPHDDGVCGGGGDEYD